MARQAVGRLLNAVEHMWGHVRNEATVDDLVEAKNQSRSAARLHQRLALRHRERFLLSSVALSELAVFLDVEK